MRPSSLPGVLGSSCTESELWNNLTAPRPFASSGFSLGRTGAWGGVGACGGRSDKFKSCDTPNGARQEQRAVSRRARKPNGISWIKLRRNEMRNWCAALAMSALLALPLCAQQKSGGTGDDATNVATAAGKSAPSSRAAGSGKAAAVKGVFALPAAPQPAPFPGPAAVAADVRTPGQLVPRYEIAGMYDYINFAPGDPFANFNTHGGSASFPYNASKGPGLSRRGGRLRFQPKSPPPTRHNIVSDRH